MFLVIFRNRKRSGIDAAAYDADAARMEKLASQQPGYLSFKSYKAEDGEVVAISEWADEAAAHAWGRNSEHLTTQDRGRASYYQSYTLYACADPRTHNFERTED
ncbi:MAG: antibiotic biosynthesis monooxygenase [Novosphingobium sp.]|nr:antibiotic biosynthesis monooxygenase [Novosphingobium sp.]